FSPLLLCPSLLNTIQYNTIPSCIIQLSEINVTEHIEGDQCKFALWTGAVPNSEHRTIMKAVDHKAKLLWVKKLRDLIGERILHLGSCLSQVFRIFLCVFLKI